MKKQKSSKKSNKQTKEFNIEIKRLRTKEFNIEIKRLSKKLPLDIPENELKSIFIQTNTPRTSSQQAIDNYYFLHGIKLIETVCAIYLYDNYNLSSLYNFNVIIDYARTLFCRNLAKSYAIDNIIKIIPKNPHNNYTAIISKLFSLICVRWKLYTTYIFAKKELDLIYFNKVIQDINNHSPNEVPINNLRFYNCYYDLSKKRKQEIVDGLSLLGVNITYLELEQANSILEYNDPRQTIILKNFLTPIGFRFYDILCIEFIINHTNANKLKTYKAYHSYLRNKDNICNSITNELLKYVINDIDSHPTKNDIKTSVFFAAIGALITNCITYNNKNAGIKAIDLAQKHITLSFRFYNSNQNIKTKKSASIITDNILFQEQSCHNDTSGQTALQEPHLLDIDKIVSFDNSNNTLIICKETFKCRKNNHQLLPATGILPSIVGNSVKINVNFCSQCKLYFIDYNEYCHYKNIYGALLGNFKIDHSLNTSSFGNGYVACESILMIYGYNVKQTENLSSYQRQRILANIMDRKIISKPEIISYLNRFINQKHNMKNYAIAVQKWTDDLNFVRNYKINSQRQFIIQTIKKK